MPKISAGVLMYRCLAGKLQFLLVHPGGPFWRNKDAGAWTIPKGEIAASEDPLTAAKREFEEELGVQPKGYFEALNPVVQKGGKLIHAWALEGDINTDVIKSNTFKMEWPPRSGTVQEFPEIDRAGWFTLEQATEKINPAQIPLLRELQEKMAARR